MPKLVQNKRAMPEWRQAELSKVGKPQTRLIQAPINLINSVRQGQIVSASTLPNAYFFTASEKPRPESNGKVALSVTVNQTQV
jgi:hypothetical protein